MLEAAIAGGQFLYEAHDGRDCLCWPWANGCAALVVAGAATVLGRGLLVAAVLAVGLVVAGAALVHLGRWCLVVLVVARATEVAGDRGRREGEGGHCDGLVGCFVYVYV